MSPRTHLITWFVFLQVAGSMLVVLLGASGKVFCVNRSPKGITFFHVYFLIPLFLHISVQNTCKDRGKTLFVLGILKVGHCSMESQATQMFVPLKLCIYCNVNEFNIECVIAQGLQFFRHFFWQLLFVGTFHILNFFHIKSVNLTHDVSIYKMMVTVLNIIKLGRFIAWCLSPTMPDYL